MGVVGRPWLRDHRAMGAALLPAAGYLEMALSLGGAVEEVRIEAPCRLPEDRDLRVQTVVEDGGWSSLLAGWGVDSALHGAGRDGRGVEWAGAGRGSVAVSGLRWTSRSFMRMRRLGAWSTGRRSGDRRVLARRGRGGGAGGGRVVDDDAGRGAANGGGGAARRRVGVFAGGDRAGCVVGRVGGLGVCTDGRARRWADFDYTVYEESGEVVGEIRGLFAVAAREEALALDWLYTTRWERGDGRGVLRGSGFGDEAVEVERARWDLTAYRGRSRN